ncbi:uncharacterized protein DUF3885 [Keratinibaculum paraultunense]|uniref:Uncharacterized protein DUF3885 n=1 Tax=Keratinibaculum paraultunense TaxID=1278232 RepID=A0A4R3KRB4_9FIRM|nr:DUF3885 domain-containing protein [Keratinibaculum paraultunense]QQY78819.1 DUF3885 domain-containing protein [Keratinibaculum paraultunense]TCS87470.1 uncharacterized protein DUF3885 [Keratinibaculum paraultunense]
MKVKKRPKDILGNILNQYGVEDKVLNRLTYKYVLHIDKLSEKYQYLEDGNLNELYVEECIQKAIEIFKFMEYSDNLLVVYEDLFGQENEKEKEFLESTLTDVIQYDTYKLKWKYPIYKDDLPIHQDDEVYTCIRHLYHVKEINIQKLFREIILSDIGGKMDFCSSVFIIDINSGYIFHLYDDRGLFLFAPKEEHLTDVWKKFHDSIFTLDSNFKIIVNSLYWLDKTKDDPNDLCLHGDITVTIGEEKLLYSCTVSAAALRMLKTLSEDHLPTKGEQMLPCCGFSMIPNGNLDEVDIIGCDNGVDWTVLHEDGMVKLITEKGNIVFIYYLQYKDEILRFADIVEDYYKKSLPKNISEDEFERNGYIAFWNEWHRRNGGSL